MKKFFYLSLCALLSLICIFFVGCKKTLSLADYLCELRHQVYEGQTQEYNLRAYYGFKEKQYNSDGKATSPVYLLTFRLLDKQTDDCAYYIEFDYNGVDYSGQFKLHPSTHTLFYQVEINGFNLKTFTAKVGTIDNKTQVTFNSVIPEGTISYLDALASLQKQQPELIKNYCDQSGDFKGEIALRLIVKDGKSFWYVGLYSSDGRLKALLIDGFSGQVLAIREVF